MTARRSVRLFRAPAIALIVTTLGAGCNLESSSEPQLAEACSTIGARCQLPGGPLGVCQEAPCDGGATPPCFKCTPQH